MQRRFAVNGELGRGPKGGGRRQERIREVSRETQGVKREGGGKVYKRFGGRREWKDGKRYGRILYSVRCGRRGEWKTQGSMEV